MLRRNYTKSLSVPLFSATRKTSQDNLSKNANVTYALTQQMAGNIVEVGAVTIFTDFHEVAFIKEFSINENIKKLSATGKINIIKEFLIAIFEDETLHQVLPYKWFSLNNEINKELANIGFVKVENNIQDYTFSCLESEMVDAENKFLASFKQSNQLTVEVTMSKDKVNINDVLKLLHETYWGKNYDQFYLQALIEHSKCYFAYEPNSAKLIGFLREFSNEKVVSYWDFVVSEEYRKQGVGKQLFSVALQNKQMVPNRVFLIMGNFEDLEKFKQQLNFYQHKSLTTENLSLMKLPSKKYASTFANYVSSLQEKNYQDVNLTNYNKLSDPGIYEGMIIIEANDTSVTTKDKQNRCLIALKANVDGTYEKLSRIVDQTTLIPDDKIHFSFFGSSLQANAHGYASFNAPTAVRKPKQIAFYGEGEDGRRGIYLATKNKIDGKFTITKIADTNMLVPDGKGNFSKFDGPYILDHNLVVFRGYGYEEHEGIYCWRGDKNQLQKIYDNQSAILAEPAESRFHLENPSFNPKTHQLAFRAKTHDKEAIYLGNLHGEKLLKIADFATCLPGRTTRFTAFGGPSITGSQALEKSVAFSGKGMDGTEGIYLFDLEKRQLSTIADTMTPVPNHEKAAFVFLRNPTVGATYIVFQASAKTTDHEDKELNGVYAYDVNTQALHKIIDSTDMLENENKIESIRLGPISISDNQVVVKIITADEKEKLYLFKLPNAVRSFQPTM